MAGHTPIDEPITVESLEGRLQTRWLARNIECHQVIDSTNRRAMALASAGAPDGTLVLAEHQTRGRGRLARSWHAPPHSSLLLSLILRAPLAPHQAQRATMLCSVAAVEAIAAETGLAAAIKWPNDILIAGKKAGGILTELKAHGKSLAAIVVGMGLNVNLDIADLPPVMTPPTSIAAELGHPVPRLPLLVTFLERADALYVKLREGWSPADEWRQHLATLGQEVRITTREQSIEGTAIDVDDEGALLIATARGYTERVLVGDVSDANTP